MIVELSKLKFAEHTKYGSVIHNLFIAKMNNCPIISTIVLPADYFQEYLNQMVISNTVVKKLLHALTHNGFEDGQELFLSTSYFSNDITHSSLRARNNFTSLKNALTELYDIWFSEGARIHRISHKVNIEHSYPAIYIQPFIYRIHSVVTHNPATGDKTNATNFDGIVHNNIKKFNERHEIIIDNVDNCFVRPKKIFFSENNKKIEVLKISEYPMTNQAFFSYLISKHKLSKITGSNFLLQIQLDNIADYIGCSLISEEKYPADLSLSAGLVGGKAIFTSTNIHSLCKSGTDIYILLLDGKESPDNIEWFRKSNGLITNSGGMVSHTATRARGMKLPAILVKQMTIDASSKQARYRDKVINEFDYIAISSGIELCWSLSGVLGSTYRLQNITKEQVDYLLKVISEYRVVDKFKEQGIEFQFHYANIIDALRKAGVKFESTFY
jgi:phosphohistidine swiveling domain-containing protein